MADMDVSKYLNNRDSYNNMMGSASNKPEDHPVKGDKANRSNTISLSDSGHEPGSKSGYDERMFEQMKR